jgi:hypothetical protein
MAENIIAKGMLSRKQYARLCIIVYYRNPTIMFFTVLGIGVLIYIFYLASINISANARGGIFILALFYAAYILARPYIIYLNAFGYFKTSRHLQEEIQYEFSEEKIVTQSESYKGERGWDNFYKIVELKHFFLMYHDARLMNIIPKTFFKNKEDVDQLRNLISAKTHLKQKLRIA